MYKHRFITDEEVLNSATLMAEVYKPLNEIPEIINELYLLKFISIDQTQLALYGNKDNKTLYAVFRGTSDTGDILQDISYFPKKYLDTKSHSGFINGFECVKDTLINEINTNIPNKGDNRLIFCGHSLGGAVSHIAFYFFNYDQTVLNIDTNNIYCITEGSPKVFVEKKLTSTHDAFTHRAIRITNADDVVPNFPPRTLILTLTNGEYTHVGQHWSIGSIDYKDGMHEHRSQIYLNAIKKEVEDE